MKKYKQPECFEEDLELNSIIALSPRQDETPDISDEAAEEGDGLAKEITWGSIWK